MCRRSIVGGGDMCVGGQTLGEGTNELARNVLWLNRCRSFLLFTLLALECMETCLYPLAE